MHRFGLFRRPVMPAVAAVVAMLVASGCSNRPHEEDPQEYARKIAAGRAAKDAEFQAGSDVVPDAKKAEFLPLAYFPVDPGYKVVAGLKPATEDVQLLMPTSTGQQRKMRRVGTMEFTLKNQPMSLVAFNEVGAPDNDRVTLMFSDMTSGTETYAAGRYIDLPRTASGIYELDFNLAYHPYCYYNPTYECPYPPAENRLKVPIHAGERMKKPGDAAAAR
ncbi:MAG TPA: DUF1684 domain-containing protein [Vicinamibacterales bacterium]|nr:DUF1684 domain-containing protein [Vicinamibacterales bacterium]